MMGNQDNKQERAFDFFLISIGFIACVVFIGLVTSVTRMAQG